MDRPIFSGEKNRELKAYITYLYDAVALLSDRVDALTALGDRRAEFKAQLIPTPSKPYLWSNHPQPSDIETGTARDVPDAPNLIDVFDGRGWNRMSRDYYEHTYAGQLQKKEQEPEHEGS